VSHRVVEVSTGTRLQFARETIETYGRKAALVVTKRIHCAMPCVAMGIPTVFIGPKTYRTEIVEEIGLKRWQRSNLPIWPFAHRIDRIPAPLDISAIQNSIRTDLRNRIAAALA
jgi:hypothetical protein